MRTDGVITLRGVRSVSMRMRSGAEQGPKIAQRFFGWGIALVLLARTPAFAAPVDPASGYIVVPEHARDLLHQCSRATPQGATGAWLPTAGQVAELETRLPAALAKLKPSKQGGYGRQYGGIVLGGRKLIYVNAFPLGVLGDFDKDQSHWTYKATHQGVMVCDGGEDFFGVLYDPATKTFSSFQFNGFA